MSKVPMMPWFPDAHIADTRLLSLEQKGAYRELLDQMWLSKGWLPDNDEKIARLLQITVRHWLKIKPGISERFVYEGGLFTQRRLLNTYNEAIRKIEQKRISGTLGAAVKSRKNLHSSLANAEANAVAVVDPTLPRPLGAIVQGMLPQSRSTSISNPYPDKKGLTVDLRGNVYENGRPTRRNILFEE